MTDYQLLADQLQSLTEDERCFMPNLANASALIYQSLPDLNWAGFYLTEFSQDPATNPVLVLGPFQGDVACYRIRKGKGVCGTAWAEATTQVVPDVELFPGHIACSGRSRSEIVVPLIADNSVRGVLDIDSDTLATFDDTDRHYLEILCQHLSHTLYIS